MDIHPPMKKMESLKEYGAHILVVTIGILIALGLEGIRETWHEHHQVKEARESFRVELNDDRHNLELDQKSFTRCSTQLDAILADLPNLIKNPPELSKRIDELQPGFWFFSTTAWESAQADGTVAHIKLDERNRFLSAFLSVKNYQAASNASMPEWITTQTFFASHHSYTTQEAAEGEQKIRTLRKEFQLMHHLADEMNDNIKDAIGPPTSSK
jgi:hypothetical protein